MIPSSYLESLTTTVLILDEELVLRYLNPAAETLFQSSAERIRGTQVTDLMPGDSECHDSLRTALATGHPFTERERPLRLPGDREITVDCTVTPLTEPDQAPAMLVELVQIDRQLRITREEQLLKQHKATRALIRGVAHEMKNPLGGLRGAAQLLERELPDEELAEYTRIIIGEADRLQALVDRMLGPSSRPQKQAVNLHEVLEYVRQLVAAEASDQVHLESDYDPSIPDICADRDLLVQAVLNILRNALQAVEPGGHILLRTRILRQYTLGHRRHKLVANVQIIDDGPGIPAELRERIFYPMVSGHDRGSGLGLSIAQALINEHGGLVECDSRPGRTVFSLLIPVEAPDGES